MTLFSATICPTIRATQASSQKHSQYDIYNHQDFPIENENTEGFELTTIQSLAKVDPLYHLSYQSCLIMKFS